MTWSLAYLSIDMPSDGRYKSGHLHIENTTKEFKRKFPADLTAARVAYQDARLEEHEEGYLFRYSLPPIPKTKLLVHKPDRT